MNNGPLPTRLIFLSDLTTTAPGTKVRFLGCIVNYDSKTGQLTVRHVYPPPPSPCPTAVVDINLLLDNMKHNNTAVGEWVNIIGYLNEKPVKVEEEKNDSQMCSRWHAGKEMRRAKAAAMVQAVMLWSAGGIMLAEYERTLAARNAAEENNGDRETGV